MSKALERYRFFQNILKQFNKVEDEGLLEDEHVSDVVRDYMDLLWNNLSKEELKELRTNEI